ncbi:hypothetical protein AGRO_1783 [Agrobacterium sp. ATCC 31749]|nr:hypothetical protein AGRO_1783 [Agrobacterium sp. ATCC 31749]
MAICNHLVICDREGCDLSRCFWQEKLDFVCRRHSASSPRRNRKRRASRLRMARRHCC